MECRSARAWPRKRKPALFLPPGARAEFVVDTPAAGQRMQLVTTKWDTGPQGDNDPARPIADIVSGDATDVAAVQKASGVSSKAASRLPHDDHAAIVQRRLYFSQLSPDPKEPDASVFYFITVFGQPPEMYRMGQPPNIVVHRARWRIGRLRIGRRKITSSTFTRSTSACWRSMASR